MYIVLFCFYFAEDGGQQVNWQETERRSLWEIGLWAWWPVMTSDDWGYCISNMMIVTTVTNHWSVTGFNVIPSLKRRKPFDTLQTRHNFNRQTSPTAHTTLYWQLRFNTGVHTFSRTVVHWVTAVRHHLTDIHLICYHALEWQSMYTYHLTLDTVVTGPQPSACEQSCEQMVNLRYRLWHLCEQPICFTQKTRPDTEIFAGVNSHLFW
jgi:hypothetical protein